MGAVRGLCIDVCPQPSYMMHIGNIDQSRSRSFWDIECISECICHRLTISTLKESAYIRPFEDLKHPAKVELDSPGNGCGLTLLYCTRAGRVRSIPYNLEHVVTTLIRLR